MDFMDLLRLSREGFQCAQILMLYALKLEDKENADLIRSMGGLNVGLSTGEGPCGALTGGCCLISYFAGKGDPEELEDPALKKMLAEFVGWFREKYEGQYGSFICLEVLEGDRKNMTSRCPEIMQSCYGKALEILQENGALD